jgi:hypothetical protein
LLRVNLKESRATACGYAVRLWAENPQAFDGIFGILTLGSAGVERLLFIEKKIGGIL